MVTSKMAQKGSDRDSSRGTNPKMVHLCFPFEMGRVGVVVTIKRSEIVVDTPKWPIFLAAILGFLQ